MGKMGAFQGILIHICRVNLIFVETDRVKVPFREALRFAFQFSAPLLMAWVVNMKMPHIANTCGRENRSAKRVSCQLRNLWTVVYRDLSANVAPALEKELN